MLVGVVYLASGLVAHIPLVALVGVLFVTAFRMVNLQTIRQISTATKSDFFIFWVTAGITIVFDLIQAILIGVLAAVFFAVRKLAQMSGVVRIQIPLEQRPEDALIAVLRLDGSMFFGAAERVVEEIQAIERDIKVVVISMSHVGILDASGANALAEVLEALVDRGVTPIIKGLRPEHLKVATNVGLIGALESHSHLFEELTDAIEHARAHARGDVTCDGELSK